LLLLTLFGILKKGGEKDKIDPAVEWVVVAVVCTVLLSCRDGVLAIEAKSAGLCLGKSQAADSSLENVGFIELVGEVNNYNKLELLLIVFPLT